jgi:hypothetical protein
MVESDAHNTSHSDVEEGWEGDVAPHDAAAYILEISRELAGLAGTVGLSKVAAALELTRDLAAEAVAAQAKADA